MASPHSGSALKAAIVPATLTEQGLASHGRLSLTMERGRLLEARWFPEDEALEDKYFGGATVPDGPGVAETHSWKPPRCPERCTRQSTRTLCYS